VSIVLTLAAAVLIGQTEAAPPPTTSAASPTEVLVAPSPHVGKGHFTLGTSGTLGYLTGTPTSSSTFSFFAGVSGGYFVHDRVLLGANLGLSVSTFFAPVGSSTTSVGLPFGVFGQYWHPMGDRLFLFAGAAIALSPFFGTPNAIGWTVTPRAGVAIFLTDWLALQPSASVAFSGTGTGFFQVNVGLGWGMAYYL
jgi:hypothetical protein